MRQPSYPTTKLHYELPQELIAQQPPEQRDGSRLLHVRVADGTFSDHAFSELPELLAPGCALVLNNSRVIPARVHGRRASGARVELLYHRWLGGGRIEAVVGSNAKLQPGERLALPEGWSAELVTPKSRDGSELRLIQADGSAPELDGLLAWLERAGELPLPPYIKRPINSVEAASAASSGIAAKGRCGESPSQETAAKAAATEHPEPADATDRSFDAERYQTVYAAEAGSVAAPTAGLHFTAAMLNALRSAGHPLREVTLHVGLGTFAPLRVDDLADHQMHREAYSLPLELPAELDEWRTAEVPVCAVGTTSLRVLHTISLVARPSVAADSQAGKDARPTEAGETAAFIYPGHGTHATDLLLTNFHLPGSTLLALVYAFGGEDLMRTVYAHAIAQRYRFFSYGDCMLIDRRGARLTADGTALGGGR